MQVTNTYSHNYLTGTQAIYNGNTIHSMDFTWDYGKGNLDYRNNNKTNLHEHFIYDDMQRCTAADVTPASAGASLSMTYDNNGNITGKSDVGDYVYGSPRPHAVTRIDNYFTDNFPNIDQNITYNKLNKAATITEGAYSMEFAYGVAGERRKVVMKRHGNPLYTKYYAEYYEKTVYSDNSARELNYIPGPDGLCAINVKNSASQYDSLYFIYKDHLGSITTLTDETGDVVQRMSFDAWGRRRNPTDWSYNNLPDPGSYILARGYTGHEHLDMFGLINMNGRMYDPVVARFLSPDDYVQGLGSQGLNRYSYCLNNPLKFTDPSGEFIPQLIGAVLGGYTGYQIGQATGHNWGSGLLWYTLAGAGVGVLTAGAANAAFMSTASITAAGFTGGFIGGIGTSLLGFQAAGGIGFTPESFALSIAASSAGGTVGGFTQGALGGIGGAFLGGSLGSITSSLVSNNRKSMTENALTSGLLSAGIYSATTFANWLNIKGENFNGNYISMRQYFAMTASHTRAEFYNSEKGEAFWLLNNGGISREGIKNISDVSTLSEFKPGNAWGHFHSHFGYSGQLINNLGYLKDPSMFSGYKGDMNMSDNFNIPIFMLDKTGAHSYYNVNINDYNTTNAFPWSTFLNK